MLIITFPIPLFSVFCAATPVFVLEVLGDFEMSISVPLPLPDVYT